MASSVTQICNRALGLLNINPIDSLEDATKEARLCKALFPQIRDELLRDHVYPFASARIMLPALATPPAFGFAYAYQIPGDNLRVLAIGRDALDPDWQPGPGRNASERYRVEGDAIITNVGAPLPVLYVQQQPNAGAFDSSFASALARALAVDCCMPLKNNVQLLNELEQQLQVRQSRARANANLESGQQERQAVRILDVRQ